MPIAPESSRASIFFLLALLSASGCGGESRVNTTVGESRRQALEQQKAKAEAVKPRR